MSDGIKKRICNPPAEMVAIHGDAEVAGLFMGAGQGSDYLAENATDSNGYNELKEKFDARVVQIEAEYVKARKLLAESTATKVHTAFDWILEKTGYEGPSGY